MKIFFDGGCRPNPGTMEFAVVAGGRLHHVANAGQGTSEEAEWLALLAAVETARALGLREVIFLGDSAAVVRQANGAAPPRGPHAASFRREAQHFAHVRVRHVRRTQNLAGIALQKARNGGV